MRSIDSERKFVSWTSALNEHFRASIKNLNFALPGIIQTYDATRKRAVVLPAIDTLLPGDESMQKPPLANVPVLHPTGGGFVMQFPLERGNPVMLLVSQRGIVQFKRAYQRSLPTKTSFFSLSDAVAIPGFGAISISPARANAATLQTEDGTTFIAVSNGSVEIQTTGDLTINANRVSITASEVDIRDK